MARKVIAVCDQCESTDSVAKWVVDGPEGRTNADLCKKHSASLKQLQEVVGVSSSSARGRSSLYTVVEVDDDE